MIRLCLVAVMLAGVGLLTIGCSHNGILEVDRCATVPPGAIPEPAGNKICNWQTQQAASALADQLVFYRSDFVGDTVEIAPNASDRINRLAQFSTTETTSLPWVVEPSGDPTLDQSRLDNVAFQLQSLGFQTTNLTLATPAAIGLTGPQAERVAGSAGSTRSNSGRAGSGIGNGFSGGAF